MHMAQYAETTGSQHGWRFDFVILEAEDPLDRELNGATEFASDDIERSLVDAEEMVRAGFVRPALITAWAGFEAAMRMRLRAAGERGGWGRMPRGMLNELYSIGILTADEFHQLEKLSLLRNQIVHGFSSPNSDAGGVEFLSTVARRLVEESKYAKQPA